MPALVIAGDHDGCAGETVVAHLIAALPDLVVARIPGTGHLPDLENPAQSIAAVRKVRSRLSEARA